MTVVKNKGKSAIGIFISAFLAMQPAASLEAAGNITLKEMDTYLHAKGISGSYNAEKLETMKSLFRSSIDLINSTDKKLEAPEDLLNFKKRMACGVFLPTNFCNRLIKDKRTDIPSKKDEKDLLPFFEYGYRKILASSNQSLEDKKVAFYTAKSILYSVFAEAYDNRRISIKEAFSIPFHRQKTKLRYLNEKERSEPLKEKKLKKEAEFLKASLSANEKLTPADIAHLDVRDDNFFWHTADKVNGKQHLLWKAFEEKIRKQTEIHLAKKFQSSGLQFNFDSANKIVFYDKIKAKGGTHPKVTVKDAYGLEYKLKWGNETYTEPVANRLYMAIGGKHQDLTYSHTARNPIILVFPKTSAQQLQGQSNICDQIHNYQSLNSCILLSRFRKNLDPYVHYLGHGSITSANLESFKMAIGPQALQAFASQESSLIGAEYVVMQDASLEYKGRGVFYSAGHMAQSTMGSENDRAMRGMGLFHMFLDNFDAKDANGKSFLVYNEKRELEFVQSPTDLGGAFRGFAFFRKRGLNHYDEQNFLRFSHKNKHRMIYDVPVLYRSKATKKATFADMLWMAEKIAALPAHVIKDAVTAANMPFFFEEVLTYKILKRRNMIAKMYGVEHLLDIKSSELKPLNIDISLQNLNERDTIARRLGLNPRILERAMLKHKLLGKNYSDRVVSNGRIASCSRSLLVNLLEKHSYPTGLSKNPNSKLFTSKRCHFRHR